MDAEDAKRSKTRKRGLFRSPNIRITCIIRNFIKSKTGHSLLPAFLLGCDAAILSSLQVVFDPLDLYSPPVYTKNKDP